MPGAVVAILIAVLVCIVAYFKWKFSYWSRKGLDTLPPTIPFGNMKNTIFLKERVTATIEAAYNRFRSKGLRHGGFYIFTKPVYIPADPEILKAIFVKDFKYFVNRAVGFDPNDGKLADHLLFMEDDRWKHLRSKLTPTFTSGKIKMMFQTMVDCTPGLLTIMENKSESGEAVDIRDVLARFTTDIIGNCAFGVECNSLQNTDAIFRKIGKRIFESSYLDLFGRIARYILPRQFLKIMKTLQINSRKLDVEDFIVNLVDKTVNYREQNNVNRKDFMHLLIQLKNKGQITDDDGDITKTANTKANNETFTMDQIYPQVFVFFAAGFETSSTTMTFAFYELATNEDVQTRARNEVREVLSKHNNQMSYEALAEMTYLERIVQETLRKYPIGQLSRICSDDYQIPNSTVILEKGTAIITPVLGIHNDPEYYPEPAKFDPDRFTEENKRKRPDYTWFGFGEGPRICIGMRFAMIQSKLGLATILNGHKLSVNGKTRQPIVMDKIEFIPCAEGGIWLNVQKA